MPGRIEATMEGVQIRIRNFSGAKVRFNERGQRTFLALLPDEETAQGMLAQNWPVKYLKPREDGDAPTPFLKVIVNIDRDPKPRLVLVTERGKTTLDYTDAAMTVLDWSNVTEADLIVSQYNWHYDGDEGISVYLQSGYFKVTENDLDLKYADTPDTESAKSGVAFEPNDEPF